MENYLVDFDQLLKAYQSLWINRKLLIKCVNSEEILRATIKKDLNDEMTHPRLRKTPYEKFFVASKRIFDSSLSIEEKLSLQHVYLEEMENVKKL